MSEVAIAGIRPRGLAPIAAREAISRQALAAEVLHGAEAYEALLPDWEHLMQLQPGALLFQSPPLISAWARHFARNRSLALATVVVRQAGRPALIWPLFVKRHVLIRVACGAGAPISQYDDILLDPGVDAKSALSAALGTLAESIRPDVVLLERVRADSALRRALSDIAPSCAVEAAPFVDLSEGLAAALAKRKPYAAKQHRKRVKRFAKSGVVAAKVAGDPAESEAWLLEALGLKGDWLRSNGRVSRAFAKVETGTCLAELARTLTRADASPRMIVAKLTLDGRTAAIEAGFLHRGTFHIYLRAFTPELAHFGAGNILTEHMLEWCAENSVDRYDMLSPGSRNKAEWQSDEVAVADYVLPMTLPGRAYAAAIPTRLAPLVRDGFYALPAGLRSAIAGMTLRM